METRKSDLCFPFTIKLHIDNFFQCKLLQIQTHDAHGSVQVQIS